MRTSLKSTINFSIVKFLRCFHFHWKSFRGCWIKVLEFKIFMFSIDFDVEIFLKRVEILMSILRRMREKVINFQFFYFKSLLMRIEMISKVELDPVFNREEFVFNEKIVIEVLLILKEGRKLKLIKLFEV